MQAQAELQQTGDTLDALRQFIDSGQYAPGDRLPAERQLMSSLGISRTSLRKCLDALEREGAIWRHVGKGTFITSPRNKTADIEELSHHVTPVQMMRARLSLEPAVAREAAANASAEAVGRIIHSHEKAMAAGSWDDYEADDDLLHREIAAATGNILLLSLFDHLNQVRRAVAWRQVIRKTDRPPESHPSFKEHIIIVNAIEQRDPVAAHAAMKKHLNSVSNRLFGDV